MLELAENDFKTGIINLIENLEKYGQKWVNRQGILMEKWESFFKEQDRNSRILEILDV